MQPPIHFSKTALAHIQRILEAQGKDQVFRLTLKKAGCSGWQFIPALAKVPGKDDVSVSADGVTVYIPEPQLSQMQGTTVDLVSKPLQQKQLMFHHPKAQGVCGCGESFYLDDQKDNE